MYWNNPTINVIYPFDPSTPDPIKQSFHDGAHCLFYDPAIPKEHMVYEQTIEIISTWANNCIQNVGLDGFVLDKINHYDIANLVKLNMWIDDIKKQGIVKPMLIYPAEQPGKYRLNNGESRCRALERLPEITTMSAFITVRSQYRDQYDHLTLVTSIDQFAEICNPEPRDEFLFTLTDPAAPYGIYWYEHTTNKTRKVTPNESYCIQVFYNYLKQHPEIRFSPEWFDTLIAWSNYEAQVQ
jgi:hypothetical protein